MYAYCLFCETQKCEKVAHIIQQVHHVRCISPQIIQRKWVKGQCLEERHQWLPGYVFLYTEEAIIPSFRVDGVIRWLEHKELEGRDFEFAHTLYRQNGVIGAIRLVEVGDRCRVDDPVWNNLQGTVIKMDRSRKRCCVEFEFDKIKRTVWVGYELVKHSDAEEGADAAGFQPNNVSEFPLDTEDGAADQAQPEA